MDQSKVDNLKRLIEHYRVGLIGTLNQLKAETLEKISASAKEGKADFVLSASETLDRIETLIRRFTQLAEEVETLRTEMRNEEWPKNPFVINSPPKQTNPTRANVKSSRETGRELRANLINKLESEGINLQPYKGETIFITKSGEKVGIAAATERQPDRWFLGLPSNSFDHAILLCKRDNGEVVEVRLPKEFFRKHGNKLSQSRGQLKFNVSRRGHVYVVQVPDTDGVDPSSFSNNYAFLS